MPTKSPAHRVCGALACALLMSGTLVADAATLRPILKFPKLDYNVSGRLDYDATTDTLTVSGTPTLFFADENAAPTFFFTGAIAASIQVDQNGDLIGGVSGDDFVLSGDLDIDGDFTVDFSGTLLTGEVILYGSEDVSATTDFFAAVFEPTGGPLASLFLPSDIGLTIISESSSFAGDHTVSFAGLAKGAIGRVPEPLTATLVGWGVGFGCLVRPRRASARRGG